MTKLQIDQAKKATSAKSCLTCRYFLECNYPQKTHKYRCQSWKLTKGLAKQIARAEADLKSVESYDLDFQYDPEKLDQTKQFERALKDLLKSEAAVAIDIRINDSDMPLAKNFLEFCTDKRFLGIKPYAKQIQAGIHLFGDACPACSDLNWYESIPFRASSNKIARKLVLLEHGVCPSCKKNRADFVRRGKIFDYVEVALLCGQRSGKSLLVSMLSAYVLHCYLKIQNPASYFGQLPNTVFHGTFVGLTYNGAKELLYDPFYNLIAHSPWFQDYHALLRESENRLGEELFKFKDTFVHYRHRNLLVYPQGPNKRTLRGRTRFLGGIDEIGWFATGNSDLIKLSGREVYDAMQASFQTLRSETRALRRQGIVDIPKPMFLNISSPSSQMDMITELYKRSLRSKNIYGFKLATWKFNPKITFEDLAEEFDNDPGKAWRNFGCEPSLSRDPFINDIKDIAPALKSSTQNAAQLNPKIRKSKSERKMLTGKLQWNWREKQIPKLLALDAGSVSNSFALAVSHNEIATNSEEITTVFDLFLELIPSRKNPISFTWLYKDIIVPICEELGVAMVVADRWQSLKILTDLEEQLGLVSDQYSVSYDDFIGFKNNLNEGKIRFPRPSIKIKNIPKISLDNYPECFLGKPVEHFVMQCLTVEDIPGRTVQKGEVTTDDIFRAAVLNYAVVTDPDLLHQFTGDSRVRSRGGIIAISDPHTEVTSISGVGVSISLGDIIN